MQELLIECKHYPDYLIDINNGVIYHKKNKEMVTIRSKDNTVGITDSSGIRRTRTLKFVIITTINPELFHVLSARAIKISSDDSRPFHTRLSIFIPPSEAKEHPIYPGYYSDPRGTIYSKTGKLNPSKNKYGYLHFSLYHLDSKLDVVVHRFVFECLSGRLIKENYVINHLDGDKENNTFSNLEECTLLENTEHAKVTGLILKGEKHPNSSLTEIEVLQIREAFRNTPNISFKDIRSIINRPELSDNTLSKIKQFRTWRSLV